MSANVQRVERRQHYGGAGSVGRRLSERWGVSLSHTNQLLHGNDRLVDRVVDVIHAYRAEGREQELLSKLWPIFQAYDARQAPMSMEVALDAYLGARIREEIVRTKWLQAPGADEVEELRRVLDRVVVRAVALRDALDRVPLKVAK